VWHAGNEYDCLVNAKFQTVPWIAVAFQSLFFLIVMYCCFSKSLDRLFFYACTKPRGLWGLVLRWRYFSDVILAPIALQIPTLLTSPPPTTMTPNPLPFDRQQRKCYHCVELFLCHWVLDLLTPASFFCHPSKKTQQLARQHWIEE
jgi:hypothetical protein